jgi:hypothetical protein
MARRYGSFTPARRAALRKAQLASAAKRKGRRRTVIRRTAYTAGAVGLVGGTAVARHKLSGSTLTIGKHGPIGASGSPTGTHGVSAYRVGNTMGVLGRKRGPLADTRHVTYVHNRVDTKVLGRKIAGAPHKVVGYIPPNARAMNKYNVPMTADQKDFSRQFGKTKEQFSHLRITEAEAMRRTNAYQASRRRGLSSHQRSKALGYYRKQQRFDSSLPPAPRGRSRSRGKRILKKLDLDR